MATELMTTKDAARACGLSESWMRHLVAKREIPVCKFGRAVRIRQEDLDDFIASHRLRSKSETIVIATTHVAGHKNPLL
jgi:hypothetical protein